MVRDRETDLRTDRARVREQGILMVPHRQDLRVTETSARQVITRVREIIIIRAREVIITREEIQGTDSQTDVRKVQRRDRIRCRLRAMEQEQGRRRDRMHRLLAVTEASSVHITIMGASVRTREQVRDRDTTMDITAITAARETEAAMRRASVRRDRVRDIITMARETTVTRGKEAAAMASRAREEMITEITETTEGRTEEMVRDRRFHHRYLLRIRRLSARNRKTLIRKKSIKMWTA